VRIILAEDSTLVREGVVSLLERFGHEVVAAVDSADALIAAVAEAYTAAEPPTLVLTDVRMPPGNGDDGLRAVLRIRENHPEQAVFVLSQYIAEAYAEELLRSASPEGRHGGIGYLLKDRIGRVTDFLQSLDVVAAGGVVVDPEVVQHLLKRPGESAINRLTGRELEVLALISEGKSNTQIAAALSVSDAAVAKHIGNIFSKLGLEIDDGHRRVQAVLAYLRR
jgi:DNA-binding NarL/FixJ family response regulator